MKKILLALPALTSLSAFGAAGDVIFKQINPSGTAITDRVQANPSAIRVYGLNSDAGTWKPTQFALGTGFSVAGAFGSQTLNFAETGTGTVTSVAVGDLSPIFTSSVADPTTAASVTFTLTDAGQSTFLAGPIIGPGAPTYRPIGLGDLPTIPNSSLQNFAITIAGTGTALGGSISRDTITGVSSSGILARTAANTLTNRTITGTANEITVTNGDGVGGNPTASLPAAITLTSKTVAGGTFNSGAFNGTVGATTPSTGAFTTLSASSTTYIAGNFRVGQNTTNSPGYGNTTTGVAIEASTGAIFASRADGNPVAVFNKNVDSTSLIFARSGNEVGSISVTATATAYNTSSDRRLKTNIRGYKGSAAIIDAIKPRVFDWKTGEKDTVGFVAQELHAAYPAAVTKGDDGEEITQQWAVDYSKLVPVLVAEIQALRARVAALEAAK